LSMGAPDRPVRQPRHPTVRVLAVSTIGALSSCGTGQSGVAPDRHCSLSGNPLTGGSDSALKRPDPLGLKCDTNTSPKRLVTTFITSNSTEFG
jgi:hypothetical protein